MKRMMFLCVAPKRFNMLITRMLLITSALVLPIFCAPFNAELTGEEMRSAKQQHGALETQDQVRAITSTRDTKSSEAASQDSLMELTDGMRAGSNDIAVEQEAKQASNAVHCPAEIPKSVRWAKNFWNYAPPTINGVTCFCLYHFFPQLFEFPGPSFPHLPPLGLALSVLPGVTLFEMRPRSLFKTAKWSHQL